MIITSMSITITLALSSLILIITLLMSQKTTTDQEKLSPFECGFNPSISPRTPFSLRFFLIAMIFLIFDVEIVLLLPFPLTQMNTHISMASASLFLIMLIMGLLHEWHKGALNWTS